jgi:hypothetical protein
MAAFRIKQGRQSTTVEADSIEIGVHSSCAVSLEDRVASTRHARIERGAAGWAVSDLGSATGTWLSGEEVVGSRELRAGDALVVGCTRIHVGVGADGALELEVDPKPFHFEPSSSHRDAQGKLVVGGDGERLVRDEVKFTRLRGLKAANLLALAIACLGAAALLAPGWRDAALSPGPLARAHARLWDESTSAGDDEWHAKHRALAGEQGCSACHDSFGGTPTSKCAQCHADLAARNHPFALDRSANPATASIELGDDACSSCHMDHSGAEPAPGLFIPEPESLQASCSGCHEEGVPELRRKPTEFPAEPHALSYPSFSHAAHAGQRCDICHERDDADSSGADRDFGRVEFATCMGCHSADDAVGPWNAWARDPALAEWSAKVAPEHRVRLAWHGSDAKGESGESRCLECHAEVHAPGLRATTLREPESIAFLLKRRSHAELFAADAKVEARHGGDKACVECHASGSTTHSGETREAEFLHALHLSTTRPRDAAEASTSSAQCAECHADLAESSKLRVEGAPSAPLAGCAACHREERDGRVEALVLQARLSEAVRARERAEFPHDVHLAAAGFGKAGALAEGCHACHEFGSGSDAFDARPLVEPGAANCLSCHDDHANVGGPSSTGCVLCHPATPAGPDPAWTGASATRLRPPTRGFSHWSRGHADSMQSGSCVDCHGDAKDAKVVADMAIPSESDAACFDCHLRERFHWRGAPAEAPR